eukprot:6842939-Alexandrium_andersonii.AAC.1
MGWAVHVSRWVGHGVGGFGFPSRRVEGEFVPPPPAPAGPAPPWLPGLVRAGGAGMWGAGGVTPPG